MTRQAPSNRRILVLSVVGMILSFLCWFAVGMMVSQPLRSPQIATHWQPV